MRWPGHDLCDWKINVFRDCFEVSRQIWKHLLVISLCYTHTIMLLVYQLCVLRVCDHGAMIGAQFPSVQMTKLINLLILQMFQDLASGC
jgi:hypothetical protein